MTNNQTTIELKDFMLESEMEQYLTENGYNILDEEQCSDSVAVVDTALEELGYAAYMLDGLGELDQTIIFIKTYQSTEQENMKIISVSTYQVLEEIADIALSVEFPKEVAKKYNLNAATVWVTYNLDGHFQHIDLASEGNSVSFELTPPELKQVADYIQENGLKEELMKRIFHSKLTAAGEMGDHPLLDGYKRLGWVTEVYPSLALYSTALSDNLYDYHIFENETGDRLMLEHTSNNNVQFICDGAEEVVTAHLKTLFKDTEIVFVTLESYNRDSKLLKELQEKIKSYEKKLQELSVYPKVEIGSVIYKEETETVKRSVVDRLFDLEIKLKELNAITPESLTENERKNHYIIIQNTKTEINLLSNTKSRLEQESYNSAMGHNLQPTIEDITEGLREILECTDGFYTADNGNRLDPCLSKFSGPINVVRKVAADLLSEMKK